MLDHWHRVCGTSTLGDTLVDSLVQFRPYSHAIASINLRAHVNVLIAFLKHDGYTNTDTDTQTYKPLARFDAGLVILHSATLFC